MSGIRGLDSFGLIHAAFGIIALVVGPGVVALERIRSNVERNEHHAQKRERRGEQ